MKPALNKFVTETGSYTVTSYFSATPSVYTGSWPQVGIVSEIYPATTPAPKDKKWFYCAPWYHHGLSIRGSGRVEYLDSGVRIIAAGNIFNIDPGTWGRSRECSQNTVNASISKALQNLKNQNINISVFVAELNKTAEMIDKRFIRIALQVFKYRREFPKLWDKVVLLQSGRLPRFRWCEIPRNWLEMQYGWKPLMGDIQGAINEMARHGVTREASITAHGSYTRKAVITIPGVPVGWGSMPWSGVEVELTETAKTYFYFVLNSLKLRNTQELGLINPAEVVWELLPYSFVVDWAIPVGSWLSGLTADVGLTYKSGCTSSRVTGRIVNVLKPHDGSHTKLLSFSGRFNLAQMKYFRRVVYPTLPVPGFYVKNPVSKLHVLNGLALLSQAFRR